MPKSVFDRPPTEITPNPSLEKRTRRTFSTDKKLRILTQADACKRGELGALLRREKIYHNQLADWRRECAVNGVAGLGKSVPGPKASQTPAQRRIDQLEKATSRLNRRREMANDCLELQKKALSMLDRVSNGCDA